MTYKEFIETTITTFGKNEDVRFEIFVKICHTLGVRIDDIAEYGIDN